MSRFRVMDAGEWTRPSRKGYRMGCCDCGLVHTMNFKLIKGRIWMQGFRNERSTAALRRGMVKRGQLRVKEAA